MPIDVVTDVRVPAPFQLEVRCADGRVGAVDVAPVMQGPVFAPLHDPASFALATVDPVAGTGLRPNGADISPECLAYGPAGPSPGYYDADEAETGPIAPAFPAEERDR